MGCQRKEREDAQKRNEKEEGRKRRKAAPAAERLEAEEGDFEPEPELEPQFELEEEEPEPESEPGSPGMPGRRRWVSEGADSSSSQEKGKGKGATTYTTSRTFTAETSYPWAGRDVAGGAQEEAQDGYPAQDTPVPPRRPQGYDPGTSSTGKSWYAVLPGYQQDVTPGIYAYKSLTRIIRGRGGWDLTESWGPGSYLGFVSSDPAIRRLADALPENVEPRLFLR